MESFHRDDTFRAVFLQFVPKLYLEKGEYFFWWWVPLNDDYSWLCCCPSPLFCCHSWNTILCPRRVWSRQHPLSALLLVPRWNLINSPVIMTELFNPRMCVCEWGAIKHRLKACWWWSRECGIQNNLKYSFFITNKPSNADITKSILRMVFPRNDFNYSFCSRGIFKSKPLDGKQGLY